MHENTIALMKRALISISLIIRTRLFVGIMFWSNFNSGSLPHSRASGALERVEDYPEVIGLAEAYLFSSMAILRSGRPSSVSS